MFKNDIKNALQKGVPDKDDFDIATFWSVNVPVEGVVWYFEHTRLAEKLCDANRFHLVYAFIVPI